ncbi:hypothetical protein ACTFIZ_012487 [Dictyostelium cf. discoideum]
MKINNSFFFISVIFVFLIILQFSTATYSKSEIEYYKSFGYNLETGEFVKSSQQKQQHQPQQHQPQQHQPQSHQRNRQNSRYGGERRSRQNPNNEGYYSNQNYYQQIANSLDETAPVYKQGVPIPKNINVGINIDEVIPKVETNKPTFSQPLIKPSEKPTLLLQPSIEPTLPTTRKPVEPEPKKTLPPTTQPPETISPKPQTTPAITHHQISTPTPSQQSHHFFYGDGRPAVADTDDKEEETKKPTRTHKPINIDDDDDDDDEETKKPTRLNNNNNDNDNKNNNNHRGNSNNNNNNNNNNDDDDEDENKNKNKNKNKGKPNIDDEDSDEDENEDDESVETEEPTITGSIEEAKTPDPNHIDGYGSLSLSTHEDNSFSSQSNSSVETQTSPTTASITSPTTATSPITTATTTTTTTENTNKPEIKKIKVSAEKTKNLYYFSDLTARYLDTDEIILKTLDAPRIRSKNNKFFNKITPIIPPNMKKDHEVNIYSNLRFHNEYFEWVYKCVNCDPSHIKTYMALIIHNIWVWIVINCIVFI